MQVQAVIPCRKVLIATHPNGGWSVADEGTPNSLETDFRIEITDDGNANYLLIYSSLDRKYVTDTWHETIASAFAAAAEDFGIEADEWIRNVR
ncbi:MAG: hypothetical protein J0H69_08565 [Burkholderiales bacterium]|nr:hypothetical protein [Burkholderiales bacterium]